MTSNPNIRLIRTVTAKFLVVNL